MCGIFAYINYGVPTQQKVVIEKLINGLRRLEYRGYDSAGIALDDGPSVHELTPLVLKSTGKIDNLAEMVRRGDVTHPHNSTPGTHSCEPLLSRRRPWSRGMTER